MNDFAIKWSEMLEQAIKNAKAAGRNDIAEYLELRATNDKIRQAGIDWLFDGLTDIADEANRRGFPLDVEKTVPHNFALWTANMVGTRLRLRQGVRCLTIEAGWTRTPNDGFMRKGALAAARVVHFGRLKFNADLVLVKLGEKPTWNVLTEENKLNSFEFEDLIEHFRLFVS